MSNESEVDRLRAELANADEGRRLTAAEKLMTTPELARQLAPELLALCATKDESLREVVMGAIEGMGPPSVSRAVEVGAFLAGEEAQVYWSATLLGRLGGPAGFAAEELAKVLSDSTSMTLRERCAWALGQMGPEAKASLPALEAATASPSPRLARFAREALIQIQSG